MLCSTINMRIVINEWHLPCSLNCEFVSSNACNFLLNMRLRFSYCSLSDCCLASQKFPLQQNDSWFQWDEMISPSVFMCVYILASQPCTNIIYCVCHWLFRYSRQPLLSSSSATERTFTIHIVSLKFLQLL